LQYFVLEFSGLNDIPLWLSLSFGRACVQGWDFDSLKKANTQNRQLLCGDGHAA
jgi:hypothetical protein